MGAVWHRPPLPAHPYPGDGDSIWREIVLRSSGNGVFEGSIVEFSGCMGCEDFEFALFLESKDGRHL